jgi:hypothetical protein
MIRIYRIISIALLIFNLTGAFYGGGSLILFPDGSQLQLDLKLLDHSPFHDFLIPGIILLCSNGLLSAFALYKVIQKKDSFEKWIMAQGAVLTGWILIQMFMIQMVFFLHYVMGGTGILLVALGYFQYRGKRN